MKMRLTIVIPLMLIVFCEMTRAQLSLPDMPGPPYPDKFGNNRWGVKYDPRVHGRGRQHGSPSTSNSFGESPQYSPPSGGRYRSSQSSSRSKWATALKPLVSRSRLFKGRRNRRPSALFDPTSDSFYKHPYTSKAIDNYVKNYVSAYNKVAQTPTSSNELASIKTFARPRSPLSGKSRPRNFYGNRRNFDKSNSSKGSSANSSNGSTGSLSQSYARATTSDNKPLYRTLDPQSSFFEPKMEKKNSDFANTVNNIYNDYIKSGDENTAGSMDSNLVTVIGSDTLSNTVSEDDYSFPYSYSIPSNPPTSSQNQPLSSSFGPPYDDTPYYGKKSKIRKPRPSSSYPVAGPLSSLDLRNHDDAPYFPGPPPSPISSNEPVKVGYSDFHTTNGHDSSIKYPQVSSFSSSTSGLVTVKSYTVSGPPPSPTNSHDTFGLVSSPPSPFTRSSTRASPFVGTSLPHSSSRNSDAPIPVLKPIEPVIATAALSLAPPVASLSLYYPPEHRPASSRSHNSKNNSKNPIRKNKLLQHTPINVLRGLLGRHERRDRDRNRDQEDDVYRPAYAQNYALSLPPPVPPPQFVYSPYVNTLAGPPVDYPVPVYVTGGGPPPPPPPHYSPLSVGISNIRDAITGPRERPHAPPPPRYSSSSQAASASNEVKTKEVCFKSYYFPKYLK